jgi:hypothetical protein
MKTRPRTDHVQSYSIGQLVDIFVKNNKKDLEGWRGPGVVLGFIGEGRVTVRWQSVVKDLPVNLIRPHMTVLNSSALPKLADRATQAAEVAAIENSTDSKESSMNALVLFCEAEEFCRSL